MEDSRKQFVALDVDMGERWEIHSQGSDTEDTWVGKDGDSEVRYPICCGGVEG